MDTSKNVIATFEKSGVDTTELVKNGRFSQDEQSWTLNKWDGDATGSVTDGEYKIEVSTAGQKPWDIQLIQT